MVEMNVPRVTIYGGGIAGGVLAKSLSSQVKVRLVDPLPFFEVPMAAPRNLVEPSFADQAILPFADVLPGVEHVSARLVELTPNGGLVEDAHGDRLTIGGDVTVLATGSRFSNELVRASGGRVEDRKAYLARYHERLASARRILIVGGGPIGVEFAGEITQTWPDKSITVVEAGSRLLAGTSEKAAAHATSFLKARGVALVLGEMLEVDASSSRDPFAPGGTARTSAGREIPYDLLISAVGGRPNTGYMNPQFADTLDQAGRIRVGSDLRVVGQDRLFAIGDINDLDENKMAAHIKGQVPVAEANILAVLAGRMPSSHYKAKTGNPLMAVTLGRRAGVIHLPPFGVITANWFARKVKADAMLVPRYRKIMGALPKA